MDETPINLDEKEIERQRLEARMKKIFIRTAHFEYDEVARQITKKMSKSPNVRDVIMLMIVSSEGKKPNDEIRIKMSDLKGLFNGTRLYYLLHYLQTYRMITIFKSSNPTHSQTILLTNNFLHIREQLMRLIDEEERKHEKKQV